MACTEVGTSPRPVMNTIGMSRFARANRSCTSSPLRSGRPTSSTRQLGVSSLGRSKNSRADAKVSTFQPAIRMRQSSASRTETSSSTTKTMPLVSGMLRSIAQRAQPPRDVLGWRPGGRLLAGYLAGVREPAQGPQTGHEAVLTAPGDDEPRQTFKAPTNRSFGHHQLAAPLLGPPPPTGLPRTPEHSPPLAP